MNWERSGMETKKEEEKGLPITLLVLMEGNGGALEGKDKEGYAC